MQPKPRARRRRRDDYPNIPPFLDRRKTAEVDEEAAAIAAQAASEKRWLQ